jgi:hypothetical protein
MITQDRILGLFKFGQRDHIEMFVRRGLLYMNALSYFVTLESDKLRGDQDEGWSHVGPPGAIWSVEHEGQYIDVAEITSPIRVSHEQYRMANVFCMYAFRASQAQSLIDPRNTCFGDTFVVLTDGDEFLRRVHAAAEQTGFALRYQLVQYVDSETYIGPMGIFRKFASFSYQSEFRIALVPGTGNPYHLTVGDLSDIALTGNLAEINEHIRLTPEQLGPPLLQVRKSVRRS